MGDSTVAYCYEVEKVPRYVVPIIFLFIVLMFRRQGMDADSCVFRHYGRLHAFC